MHIQSILNCLQPQPGFVYTTARWHGRRRGRRIDVKLRPRVRSRPRCSGCQQRGPGYDRLAERAFQFVPVWNVPVFFLYALRRVACRACGVTVEAVPWVEGKHQLTTTYAWFLAGWAKRLSWTEVAEAFQTTWTHVFCAVEMAVTWGRAHQDLTGIKAVGIDEIQWRRGHTYLTLVYQLDAGRKRLLWLGEARKVKTLLRFFRWFGPKRSAALQFICSDMWQPYLRVVAKKAATAAHILDRFHIMAHLSKAIDEVRAQEARRLKAHGYQPLLKHTRWLLLKRPEHLKETEGFRLATLLGHNLRTARSYLLREEFQLFWTYVSPTWAGRFLDHWCTTALRSRIEPMQKVARMLRRHRPLLLNWFRAKGAISSGTVEGFNNKAKLVTRRAYGFRTFRAIELALYHTLGALPEPEVTHRFS